MAKDMPGVTAQTEKSALRREALARRAALSAEARDAAAAAVASRAFPVAIASGDVVAGYVPIRAELDPLPLMQALAARGARLALPVIGARDAPLIFREWTPGAPLVAGPLGIPEPGDDAPRLTPRIVLTPLAAFDRACHRIGYGGGHYDRTLSALRRDGRAIAVGLAFAAQEIPQVPALAHDARLDFVLTEAGIIEPRSG